jgi:hypothetical protein
MGIFLFVVAYNNNQTIYRMIYKIVDEYNNNTKCKL